MAGTLRKIGNNKYRLEYMFKRERYSTNVSASSASEASRKLAVFVTEVEKGHFQKQSNITFVEFAQLWIDKYATDNLSPTTLRSYKNILNKYILNEFGRTKLSNIKRLQVQEFANKLVVEYNLSSKSAKNLINLISSILGKAIEWEFIENNVADKVSIPKNLEKPKKKVILYSYDEIRLFIEALDHLENKELQIAIYTSLYTGARRGEVMALTFNDIDFTKKTIDFNKSKISVVGGSTYKGIKNEKNRLFYVPNSYISKIEKYYKYLGKPPKETNLFTMHLDTYSKSFKRFLFDNNLRTINLKDLRALNESILVNQGLDVVSVAKRLGHLPSTATNYYLDQIPEEDKKASNILEKVL